MRVGNILTCLLAAALAAGCALPLVSESELEIQAETEFRKMRNAMPVSNDVKVRSYVNCVTRAIIAELEPPYSEIDWEVEVFADDAVNAFAMPGGKIGVFTGILKVAENQDQLAAVIGHEVAHVTERHSLERANREMTTQIGVIGANAALGGGQATGDLLSMGARLGLSLPYGRAQESESDVVGLKYMAAAGFDPLQSVQLWKNMRDNKSGEPPPFLSTHPSSDTRIEDLLEQQREAIALSEKARAAGKRPACGP